MVEGGSGKRERSVVDDVRERVSDRLQTRVADARRPSLAHVIFRVYFFTLRVPSAACCCNSSSLFVVLAVPLPSPPRLWCTSTAMGYETYNPYTSMPAVSSRSPAGANPLHGFLPRKVTAEQVTKAMVCPFWPYVLRAT